MLVGVFILMILLSFLLRCWVRSIRFCGCSVFVLSLMSGLRMVVVLLCIFCWMIGLMCRWWCVVVCWLFVLLLVFLLCWFC